MVLSERTSGGGWADAAPRTSCAVHGKQRPQCEECRLPGPLAVSERAPALLAGYSAAVATSLFHCPRATFFFPPVCHGCFCAAWFGIPWGGLADLQGRGAGTSAPPGDERRTQEGFQGHYAAPQLTAVRHQGPVYAEAPCEPLVGSHASMVGTGCGVQCGYLC